MTSLNKKILTEIEESDFEPSIKSLLKTLLLIEYRNIAESNPLYSKEYDRIIINHMLQAENEMGEK